MNRTEHNRLTAWLLGFSGNQIHAHMDRFAKTDRQNHREVGGHDTKELLDLMFNFSNMFNKQNKLTPQQVFMTWLLHKAADGASSGFGAAVRQKVKNYGKKTSDLPKPIQQLKYQFKREMFRL